MWVHAQYGRVDRIICFPQGISWKIEYESPYDMEAMSNTIVVDVI